ncbi:MAG: hypothetical protein V4760_12500 [Bdellovibrionota bacterium]
MQAYAIRRYMLWTTVAVVLMGAIVLLTLAQPPSPLRAQLRRPSSIAVISSRGPAAALPTTATSAPESNLPLSVELTLPCEGQSDYPKKVTQIRLSGSSCSNAHAKREIVSVELLNDANGFSATVFYPTPKTFTTDYVALVEGENKIKILINYANGEREERLHVIARR